MQCLAQWFEAEPSGPPSLRHEGGVRHLRLQVVIGGHCLLHRQSVGSQLFL